MFIPRAHVRLSRPDHGSRRAGLAQYRRRHQRRLRIIEIIRMPCLLQTCLASTFGLVILFGGAAMSGVGYNPSYFLETIKVSNITKDVAYKDEAKYYILKTISYTGPIFMGVGLFIMIVACVLYCEIKDKYVNVIPPKHQTKTFDKRLMYDRIINEFRKHYFRGIDVPLKHPGDAIRTHPTLFKALSLSTPALLLTPEFQRKWKSVCDSSLRHIAIGRPKTVHFREPKRPETWLKTSSLPNIRRTHSVQSAAADDEPQYHPRRKTRKAKSCDPFQDPGFDNIVYASERDAKRARFNNKQNSDTVINIKSNRKPRNRYLSTSDQKVYINLKKSFDSVESRNKGRRVSIGETLNEAKKILEKSASQTSAKELAPMLKKQKASTPTVYVQYPPEYQNYGSTRTIEVQNRNKTNAKHPLIVMRETSLKYHILDESTLTLERNTTNYCHNDQTNFVSQDVEVTDENKEEPIPTSDDSFGNNDQPKVIIHEASVHCHDTDSTWHILRDNLTNTRPPTQKICPDKSIHLDLGELARVCHSVGKSEPTFDASSNILKSVENLSNDSLQLTEELMKNFEMVELTADSEQVL